MIVLKMNGKNFTSREDFLSACKQIKTWANKNKVVLLVSTSQVQAAGICAITLESLGVRAINLNAQQLGIYVKGDEYNRIITRVDSKQMLSVVKAYDVVVFASCISLGENNITGGVEIDKIAAAISAVFEVKIETIR